MARLASNVCFALIFLSAGLIVGVFVSWAGLLLLALVNAAIHGGPFVVPRSSAVSQIRLIVVLAIGMVMTAWLFYKKLRIDRRWGNGAYLKCLRCGYDLRGNQTSNCPECGYTMTFAQQEALRGREE